MVTDWLIDCLSDWEFIGQNRITTTDRFAQVILCGLWKYNQSNPTDKTRTCSYRRDTHNFVATNGHNFLNFTTRHILIRRSVLSAADWYTLIQSCLHNYSNVNKERTQNWTESQKPWISVCSLGVNSRIELTSYSQVYWHHDAICSCYNYKR